MEKVDVGRLKGVLACPLGGLDAADMSRLAGDSRERLEVIEAGAPIIRDDAQNLQRVH